jgi:DNA (cytosine-5)-methyltransferase 1
MDTYALLDRAISLHSKKEVAALLGVSAKTVGRWHTRETPPPPYLADAIRQRCLPLAANDGPRGAFRFIDLFAGIGGIRRGFDAIGGSCVFTSEWDEYAKKTYLINFPSGPSHSFAGDITTVAEEDVPDHDVLLAGFPCQPFSIAGVSKKNALGRPHGFADATQGTLFFDVARIIAAKRPKAFLLENVRNLVGHDKGRTFSTILDVLTRELGYHVSWKVINAKHFVPQHRERVIIVGFCQATGFSWDALRLPAIEDGPKLGSILHREDGSEPSTWNCLEGAKGKVSSRYVLSDKLWQYLQDYAAKHRAKGNGFGFGLTDRNQVARTLSARYYKDGSEILVDRGRGRNPRRLTPRECARLMGFDDDFQIPVSDTRAYKQFGNSVVVPVIREVARIMQPHILQLVEDTAAGMHQEPLLAVGADA